MTGEEQRIFMFWEVLNRHGRRPGFGGILPVALADTLLAAEVYSMTREEIKLVFALDDAFCDSVNRERTDNGG